MTDENRSRLGIDWPTTIAGALAAVTVAVLLSTLGAAGTLVGAAVGSVVATLATAVYRQGIDSSRRKVAQIQGVALVKVGVAQDEVRRAAGAASSPTADLRLARARDQLDEALAELEPAEAADQPAPVRRWAALPWRRIAAAALGLFVVVVLAISAFELLTGRSVSSYTGGTDGDSGTSVSNLVEDEASTNDDPRRPDRRDDRPVDQPTPDAGTDDPTPDQPTPTSEPTEATGPTEPTESPTTEPTETGEPTGTPTTEPTETGEPTGSPTESPTATP